MKLIKIQTALPRDEVLSMIKDSDYVNDKVLFDERRGKPQMRVKEKGNRLHITCTMIGGNVRDNGFFIGTYFSGKLTEKNGVTTLKGVTLTAPIYHLGMIALLAFFVYKCIELGGFNPVPIILAIFSIYLFKDEFKKQGIIARYLARAVRKAEEKAKSREKREA